MLDISFLEIIALFLLVVLSQTLARFIVNKVEAFLKKGKSDEEYKLYINDKFQGLYTHTQCLSIYEEEKYKSHKTYVSIQKSKKFYIDIDSDNEVVR